MTAFPYVAPLSLSAALTFPAGLQGLANGSSVLSTDEIDNTVSLTARWTEIAIEVYLNTLNPVAPAFVDVALIPKIGGNYMTASAGSKIPIGSGMVPIDSVWVEDGSAVKRVFARFSDVLPIHYKVLIVNYTGVAFNAASNTVKWAGTLPETR